MLRRSSVQGRQVTKIAVITVEGIIDGELAKDVYQQLKKARQDKRVKGVIIRVDSPGGLISASDQIYKEILKFRQERASRLWHLCRTLPLRAAITHLLRATKS